RSPRSTDGLALTGRHASIRVARRWQREGFMNLLGVHALVFAGSWSKRDRERAVGGAARLGYDLIEIPLLDPKSVDAAATAKLIEKHGIKGVTSLGLNFNADISSPNKAIAKRGEALLQQALAVTRDIGATYMGGVI